MHCARFSAVVAGFCLALSILVPTVTRSCTVAGIPTPYQLVRQADVILYAIADRYVVEPPTDIRTTGRAPSIVEFQVVEVIKGHFPAASINLNGYLTDRDDYNDGQVPLTFVRSDGRSGSCFANSYRQGGYFLLILKDRGGKLDANWAALAPINEQITGSEDPWLAWVRNASFSSEHYSVELIAKGVYAVIQSDPLGLANHANSVFIENDDDVIVVDTQFTLERTKSVLATIRQFVDKPVSVLINTHWHDDHTFGNQIYKEAFPSIEIISHRNTKTDMATVGVDNRKSQLAGAANAITMFQGAIEKQTAIDGTPMSDDERAAYESTIAIAQEYVRDNGQFVLTLPSKTFGRRMTLERAGRKIEIRHFGPAVTRGDVVVYLPDEGVLITGDLFDDPVSFAYGCDLNGWIDALDSMLSMRLMVVVPGHGGTLAGAAGMSRLRYYLEEIKNQTREGASKGKSREQIQDLINLPPPPAARDQKMVQFLFTAYFVEPAVNSIFDSRERQRSRQ